VWGLSGFSLARMKDCLRLLRRRDSVVGIATGYGVVGEWVGVRGPARPRIFSAQSRPALSCVRRPGREAGHSPPAGACVQKTWIYASTAPHAFMFLCLGKHRDSFALLYFSL
jgi:hypothetical protein